jgi:hypothetical protein
MPELFGANVDQSWIDLIKVGLPLVIDHPNPPDDADRGQVQKLIPIFTQKPVEPSDTIQNVETKPTSGGGQEIPKDSSLTRNLMIGGAVVLGVILVVMVARK